MQPRTSPGKFALMIGAREPLFGIGSVPGLGASGPENAGKADPRSRCLYRWRRVLEAFENPISVPCGFGQSRPPKNGFSVMLESQKL